MAESVITIYRCTNCKAEDRDRGDNPPAPTVLGCWKCKAGMRMSIEDMLANQVGMFPAVE